MLEEIKKELIKNPSSLKDVLEEFNYCNIITRPKYMQFGRDEFSSKKSIVIKLENNDFLWVVDYARNVQCDLFTYIINQRHVEFKEVLNVIKSKLHITDYYDLFNTKRGIFGGFYNNVRTKNSYKVNTYDESILKRYKKDGNRRFFRDNISLAAQQYFNIGYDTESQCITIPIRDQFGQLMGVKARCNWEVADGEQKYYYLVPCQSSVTLYGYSQNYQYLTDNIIYILESEKGTLQCFSYGIRNCVSLGSGSLSKTQAKMICGLHPSSVIFLHDQGYSFENIQRNMDLLKGYSRFSEFSIGYWNWENSKYLGYKKISPTDLGKEVFNEIILNEIIYYKE